MVAKAGPRGNSGGWAAPELVAMEMGRIKVAERDYSKGTPTVKGLRAMPEKVVIWKQTLRLK